MNRIFFALIAIAFVTAGSRQLLYETGRWRPGPDLVEVAAMPADTAVEVVGFVVSTGGGVTVVRDGATTVRCAGDAPAGTREGAAVMLTGVTAAAEADGIPVIGGCKVAEYAPPMQAVTNELFNGVKAAVLNVVLPLIGAMAFFLGVMKIAEKGGAMLVMAKLVRPLMVRLFPEVPANHPAMSAMILNIAANALGLGNAATPFGLRAMQELDKLNPEKGTATNAMALFLAINTSSVTLLATGVMSMRAGLGSGDPAGVIPTTLFATMCSTIVALASCKLLERFVAGPKGTVSAEVLAEQSAEDAGAYPGWVSAIALLALLGAIPLTVIYGEVFGQWIVPLIVTGFVSYGFVRGVAVYDAFIEGAKEGFDIAVRIIPYLVAILGTVGMLRGSGAIDAFTAAVGPLTAPLGMPAEAVPMVLLRPLSGSGASGLMVELMKEHTPDSYIGYLVSTMQGSSETTFYVLAVYFGSVQISRIRHAMVPGLLADLAGAIGSVIAVQMYFSYNGLWPT